MSYQFRTVFLIQAFLFIFSASFVDLGWAKVESKASLSESEQKILFNEAMNLWRKRDSQDSLNESLSKLELVQSANPTNLEVLIYLTRGHYFLADAHLDNSTLKIRHFEKAISFGEKAMATNVEFAAKTSGGKNIEDGLDLLTVKEVPAIYWTAASIGKWAKEEGKFTYLKNKGKVKAMIERVEKLQPDYFFNAPSRYLGAMYAALPYLAGGDLEKSKKYFDQAIKEFPEYLGTQVLMAEFYWTKKDNKKEFENMLKAVLLSNHDKHPEIGPENLMEKKKAEKLLEQVDDLF
jgi:tetratricopeptide (TPR) repeat protein